MSGDETIEGLPGRFMAMDMQELMDEGVLMAANEMFFWPLGMALTWTVLKVTKSGEETYGGALHVREWLDEKGEWTGETIELAADDPVGIERARRFEAWLERRQGKMKKEDER